MGLIQREIERAGISTIGISFVRRFSEKVKPPRTLFVNSPYGCPMGTSIDAAHQRAVLSAMLKALDSIETPGDIIILPMKFTEPVFIKLEK